MTRSPYIQLLCMCLLLAGQTAMANDEQSVRIGKQDYRTTGTMEQVKDLQFKMFVDPLKTNWIAWSHYNTAQEWQSQSLIDLPTAGNIGFDDYAVLTVVAPDGTRSAEFTMDQNDAQGRSFGQQAVIYGKRGITPDVARATPEGDIELFDEAGVADTFFDDHGQGVYQFEVKVYNRYGDSGGMPTMYLIKNASEGYEVKPPIQAPPYRGMGAYWPGDDNHDDDDDGGNPPPEFPDLPSINPFPNNPDEAMDLKGGGDFPQLPQTVIPEPATLALTGLGLGLMARRFRRRD